MSTQPVSSGVRPKKNILIICTHLRQNRGNGNNKSFLQPLTGLHIASIIDRDAYNVTLYHEMWHGTYRNPTQEKYDLVFLTGLQKDFDRMRQLSYFFKKANAKTIAGGNMCTMFPEYTATFFDSICVGGVDSVAQILADYEQGELKAVYKSPSTYVSQYKVDHSILRSNGINMNIHFIEASRGCNFKCDFCVLPAEGAKHTTYTLEKIKQEIDNALANSPWYSIRKLYPTIYFLDNNFSNNKRYMNELCDYLKNDKRIKAWGALCTQDIIRDRAQIDKLAASKCNALFSGIESFDLEFLSKHKKRQNIVYQNSIIEDIAYAQKQGIIISYGYLFDPRITSISAMHKQLATIADSRELSTPAFISVVSPLLGTQLFWKSAQEKELLPNLLLRDLDGNALAYKNTVDKKDELGLFIRKLMCNPNLFINAKSIILKTVNFILKTKFNPMAWLLFYLNCDRLNQNAVQYNKHNNRTYIGGEDALDSVYNSHPDDISKEDYIKYFTPTMVTDSAGNLADWLEKYRPSLYKLNLAD